MALFLLLSDYLLQVPGESLKLKQLKALIDEHSPSTFSSFTSKKEALTFLKHKVFSLAQEMLNFLLQVLDS